MLLGSAMFVSPAFSQSGGTPPPAGGQGGKGGDLGGPPVGPGAHEGDGDFGGEGRPGKGGKGGAMGQRMQSGRAWMNTWAEFKGQLPADVQAKAEKIRQDFEAKVQEWQKTNGAQMKELADKARNAGGAPDPETMKQMKALNESRPKMEESQKQIFALLTPEQQDAFKKSLAANEAKLKEQAGKRGAGGEGGEGKGGKGKGGKGKGGKGGDKPTDGDGNPPPPPMDQ
jgi:hypothetical protein